MTNKEDTTALKKIYERLRADDKVKNQKDFAERICYDQHPVSKMLLGTKPIPNTLLVNLYNTFSVNINFIVSKGNGAMFLNETEKVTKKDLERANELKEENEKIKIEIDILKKMIADKEMIIELLKKQKS